MTDKEPKLDDTTLVVLEVSETNIDTLNREEVWEDNLIEEVKCYPLLWDRTRRDYGHQEKYQVVWAQVAKAVGRTANVCQSTWKNLRDSYVRRLKSVRRLAFHGLTPRKPSWRHFDAMSFLDGHVNHRVNQVDTMNDNPLPNCSAKNVAFFDDGRARAPNKNKLGGMGKEGPSQVRISALPKEPVALFSRIGLGEISVVDDTSILGPLEIQDGADVRLTSDDASATLDQFQNQELQIVDGSESETVEKIVSRLENQDGTFDSSNILHIIVEENDAEHFSTGTIPDKTESVKTLPDLQDDKNAPPSPNLNQSQSSTDNPENTDPPDDDSDASAKPHNLRPGRKRSYRQLADVDDAQIDNVSDDVINPERKRKTEKPSEKSEIAQYREEIRQGFLSIRNLLDSQNDENYSFARSVAANLARLPETIRAQTKLRIQQILYEAELISAQQNQSEYFGNATIVAVQDGDTLVVCDGADLQQPTQTTPPPCDDVT